MRLPSLRIHELAQFAVQVETGGCLSFSLRTLFVIVTGFAIPLAWAGHSLSWIRQRHQILDGDAITRAYSRFDLPMGRRPPGGLWLFGEKGMAAIFLNPLKPVEKNHVERLFPEADVFDGP